MWPKIRNVIIILFTAACWVAGIWYGYQILWREAGRGQTLWYLLWAVVIGAVVMLLAGAWVLYNLRLARRMAGRRKQAVERDVNREQDVMGRRIIAEQPWETLIGQPVVEIRVAGNEKRYLTGGAR